VAASASVGLISAAIVCTVLHLRREPRPSAAFDPAVFDPAAWDRAARWRDSITTRNLAMAGV
jgi:hypothetical protein